MFKLFKKTPAGCHASQLNGQSFIVHAGFPDEWLKELLKQPGGGSYFRLDTRLQTGDAGTPVEVFIHQCLNTLKLPPPAFIKVKDGQVYVRSLLAGSHWLLPTDMTLLDNEIETRFHFKLQGSPQRAGDWETGMPLSQNDLDYEAMLSEVTLLPDAD